MGFTDKYVATQLNSALDEIFGYNKHSTIKVIFGRATIRFSYPRWTNDAMAKTLLEIYHAAAVQFTRSGIEINMAQRMGADMAKASFIEGANDFLHKQISKDIVQSQTNKCPQCNATMEMNSTNRYICPKCRYWVPRNYR